MSPRALKLNGTAKDLTAPDDPMELGQTPADKLWKPLPGHMTGCNCANCQHYALQQAALLEAQENSQRRRPRAHSSYTVQDENGAFGGYEAWTGGVYTSAAPYFLGDGWASAAPGVMGPIMASGVANVQPPGPHASGEDTVQAGNGYESNGVVLANGDQGNIVFENNWVHHSMPAHMPAPGPTLEWTVGMDLADLAQSLHDDGRLFSASTTGNSGLSLLRVRRDDRLEAWEMHVDGAGVIVEAHIVGVEPMQTMPSETHTARPERWWKVWLKALGQ